MFGIDLFPMVVGKFYLKGMFRALDGKLGRRVGVDYRNGWIRCFRGCLFVSTRDEKLSACTGVES